MRIHRCSIVVLYLVASSVAHGQLLPVPTTLLDFFQPGTQPLSMVDPVIGGTGCTTCHAGEGFDDAVPHPPVARGCVACHEPHGGAQAALLNQPTEALCASCHPSDAGFSASHDGLSV